MTNTNLSYQKGNPWFYRLMKNKYRYWQRLVPSPTRSNESLSIELSWAWKPTYKRSACRLGVGKRSLCRVFRLEQFQQRIQFKNLFEFPRINKGGGLAIFWKEDFPLEIETYSKDHIDTTINKNIEKEWRFTKFYEEPDTHKRHESWTKLRQLKTRGSAPWLYVGDFNEITRQSEKQGGRPRPHHQMQLF